MMLESVPIPRDEIAAEARAWEAVFQELYNLSEEAKLMEGGENAR